VNPVGLITAYIANEVVYGAVVPRRILELAAPPMAPVSVMESLLAQGLVVVATVRGSPLVRSSGTNTTRSSDILGSGRLVRAAVPDDETIDAGV